MSDAVQPDEPPAGRSKLPLMMGLVLALLLGAGGFFVTNSGLIGPRSEVVGTDPPADLPEIAFLPVAPVTISMPGLASDSHLRFTAQLEVVSAHAGEVELLMPRIVDVLNGYLRAVQPASLQEAGALIRIRAQLLRRIQIVTGEGRVRDLLVTEFLFS
ncbi:flagellar basal body-associated FliL family protein [Paragemmobacter ruber]|uniref:Flagellar protein FliL n=1 Tax=Paragemmobacter ruber TaxID=1985673 RepID=A0ABW9Y691_9RHOB|nr:flagellar basal body-associated FliL family protein [Rhodobacter ruber]NBE07369.1 flagellar basal body protein FliL [Rhodobacter ruber]